ncbi:hypothetical protein C6P42_004151 [Pichia californica]|nr:hypothetical protein C6P42_004151 [[Candida] californica]
MDIDMGDKDKTVTNININKNSSATANAILNILQQISISPSKNSPLTNLNSNSNNNNSIGEHHKLNRSALQHLHSLPKSLIPKRRLSSSSSFDGLTVTSNDKTNKKQLIYLRGQQQHKVNNNCGNNRPFPSPLSRSHFIKRLSTFSVLNWTIIDIKLSPLFCAAQGFKCHPMRKNELHCTSCHSTIIIKLPENPDNKLESEYNLRKNKKAFNNLHHTDNYNQILNNTDKYELPYQYQLFEMLDDELEDELNDDIHIYETLVNSYVSRLSTDHYHSCSFLPLLPLSPNDDNYYITSKDIVRETVKFNNRLNVMKKNKYKLIGKNFKRSFLTSDEIQFLKEYLRKYSDNDNDIDIDIVDDDNDDNYNNISNNKEKSSNSTNKMNLSTNLTINPSLDVILPALLGWELKIQKFYNEKFLLLNCECCTRRILLSTIDVNMNANNFEDIEELNACPYKAQIPVSEEMTEFDEAIKVANPHGNGTSSNYYGDDEDDDMIDLEQEHDSWCCMRQGWRVVLEGLRSYADVEMPAPTMVPSTTSSSQGSSREITELYNTNMDNLRNF